MQEYDNIHFEPMPDLGVAKPIPHEKGYTNLYEEMIEKCHPKNYLNEGYDRQLFSIANSIYYELTQRREWTDEELIPLRNKAITELGIHFSTKKKYNYLLQYLDPRIYINMNPYPARRVATAEEYYNQLNTYKDDIVALEELEKKAKQFIEERQSEIEEDDFRALSEKKRKEEEVFKKDKALATRMIIAIAIIFGIFFLFMAFG